MVSFAGLAIACSLALIAVDKTSEVAFENLKASTTENNARARRADDNRHRHRLSESS